MVTMEALINKADVSTSVLSFLDTFLGKVAMITINYDIGSYF